MGFRNQEDWQHPHMCSGILSPDHLRIHLSIFDLGEDKGELVSTVAMNQ